MRKVAIFITLCGLVSRIALAADDEQRIGKAPISLSAVEIRQVAEGLCGPGHFHADHQRIHCHTCPLFTSGASNVEEWTLSSPLRIHLPKDGSEQLLFDTDGCEPHFQEFGGALLLQRSTDAARPSLQLLFYRPGFRLNDCLRLPQPNQATLLVCNEEFMAQGELSAHLSLMQIGRDEITRWRLLRWYDNSGSESQQVLRVVPTAAQVIDDRKACPVLQVDVAVTEASRADYETNPGLVNEHLVVRFERTGDRLFPDAPSKAILKRLEKQMANFVDG